MDVITAPPALPDRPHDANKVSAGRVLVVGGSRDMAGAPAMAGLGALRAGAGLVRVAVPESLQRAVASYAPEFTSAGLPEEPGGTLGESALETLGPMAQAWDVVVLGPGLGRSPGTGPLIRTFTSTVDRPLVLDADGLYAWNERVAELRARSAPTVLTPHEGEAARLLGSTSADIRADRRAAAARLAKESGAVVVLKGPDTIVTDGETLYVNPTGGPVLATGGTGDVLAGAAGALLAQAAAHAMTPFQATCIAVYVHGAAADHVAAGRDRGLLATELAGGIPDALAALRAGGDAGTSP